MASQRPGKGANDTAALTRARCPTWCVTDHGWQLAEEDWVHTGEPLVIAGETAAQLCMSIHPATGVEDGPYVLIGTRELTLDEVVELAASLLALTRAAATLSRPAAL